MMSVGLKKKREKLGPKFKLLPVTFYYEVRVEEESEEWLGCESPVNIFALWLVSKDFLDKEFVFIKSESVNK